MASGVSPKFIIDNTLFKLNNYGNIKRYTGTIVNPPQLTSQGLSQALVKWVNPYPDIAFQKIVLPHFDGVYKFTAQISNDPDFIKDYHFIALMRCIDLYNKDVYSGNINIHGDTPAFT